MTYAAIRTLLRRQINEVTAQTWQDSDLDVYIQIALNLLQKEITKIDPEAFRTSENINLVAGTTDYTLATSPTAHSGVLLVERKSTTSSTTYARQVHKDLNIVRDFLLNGQLVSGAVGDQMNGVYAVSGMSVIVISPAPDAAVTAGLRVTLRPVLTQGMDSDSPQLPSPLHYTIALLAKTVALGETYQDTALTEKRLNEVLADLPFYYSRDDGEAPQLRPTGLAIGTLPFPNQAYRWR